MVSKCCQKGVEAAAEVAPLKNLRRDLVLGRLLMLVCGPAGPLPHALPALAAQLLHLAIIPNWLKVHAGNIQGTFREHSGNVQGTFRERSGNTRLRCAGH
jgi:hypothetical protein